MMEKKIHAWYSILLLCICNISIDAQFSLSGKTILNPRSSSTNAARDLVGSRHFMYQYNAPGFYGTCSITAEYAQTYRTHRLAEYFFNQDSIIVSGSMIEDRNENDLLADYFGLSPHFKSIVEPRPHISYSLATLDWFLGYKRAYGRIIVPFGKTRWHVCLEENIIQRGAQYPFPAQYMSEQEIAPAATSFNDAMKGVSYGQISPLQFGIIDGAQSVSGASDLVMILGYLLVSHEDSHVGMHLRAAAPTGNKPDPRYFFTPILGNGNHWELGLGFTNRVIIWHKNDDQTIDFHFDINGTYLFKSRQCRSFDLILSRQCDDTMPRFGSRYILTKNFDINGNYLSSSAPLINTTTLDCKVNANLQLDLAFMFAYRSRFFDFDIGYNAWIKSRENISFDDCITCISPRGLKGIQNVVDGMPLSPSVITQSSATLHGNQFTEQMLVADTNSPVLLSFNDIDISSAETSFQLTHKIFWHMQYRPYEYFANNVMPYVGIGGQVEFEGVRPDDSDPFKITRSLWAIWLKGGIGY